MGGNMFGRRTILGSLTLAGILAGFASVAPRPEPVGILQGNAPAQPSHVPTLLVTGADGARTAVNARGLTNPATPQSIAELRAELRVLMDGDPYLRERYSIPSPIWTGRPRARRGEAGRFFYIRRGDRLVNLYRREKRAARA